jgi:hypothetical protein
MSHGALHIVHSFVIIRAAPGKNKNKNKMFGAMTLLVHRWEVLPIALSGKKTHFIRFQLASNFYPHLFLQLRQSRLEIVGLSMGHCFIIAFIHLLISQYAHAQNCDWLVKYS